MTHLTVGGHLKIYLGYAPGVGKTYQMLEDARALKARGVDLVIGFVESHGRNDIRDRLEGLQTVPLKRLYTGAAPPRSWTLMPSWLGVREFVWWTNWRIPMRPGRRGKSAGRTFRCCSQAGIDVLTTMNVQDLASLSDQIWQLTGLRVRENVPDWLFQQADEVVIVDVTPRALLHRLERGVIYPPDRTKGECRAALSGTDPGCPARIGHSPDGPGSGSAADGKKAGRIANGKNPGQRHRRSLDRHVATPGASRRRPSAGRLYRGVCPLQGGVGRRARGGPANRRSPSPLRRESAHFH